MLDEKDLQAIAQLISASENRMSVMMDKKLEPINARLDEIQGDIDFLKEETTVTRGGVFRIGSDLKLL